MLSAPKFTWFAFLCLLLTVGCAVGVRTWYLLECTGGGWYEPALQVQGDAPRLDHLADNVAKHHWFGGVTPFSDQEELTAHIAPGYACLLGFVAEHRGEDADWTIRWLQCALGSLTAGCYFFFARRAFHNTLIALVAGLLAALHPFWIINTAELNDGVLTSFALSVCLMVGTRSSQNGGPLSGFAFGLSLAGLCMVRAVFLPFAIVAALWFLWRGRRFPLGWLAAVLMLVGFVNGLAPWALRNYQLFERPVPVATSTYYHLWMGNNPAATGATLDESAARAALDPERLKELLAETNQAKRYEMLAHDAKTEITRHPAKTLSRRISAALAFVFGERWFKENHLVVVRGEGPEIADTPDWIRIRADHILHATLLGLLALALLGWRFSHAWRVYSRLGTIAAIFIPLPYILSHADALAGPRLPFDGILLCFAAYAIVSLIPGAVRPPEPLVKPAKEK